MKPDKAPEEYPLVFEERAADAGREGEGELYRRQPAAPGLIALEKVLISRHCPVEAEVTGARSALVARQRCTQDVVLTMAHAGTSDHPLDQSMSVEELD